MKGTKTGGRTAGTPNKLTETKQQLQELFYKHVGSKKFENALNGLRDEKYFDAVLKLAPFVIAKPRQDIEVKTSGKPNLPPWMTNDIKVIFSDAS